ncbi:1,4-dihydroxy-2-naphthoyl-CoA hydrolase [Leminorella grimontii]|uniref:1,4-dihydroxy-2-naphthoyl-CoA hydrolase n=1 Tax=Leminorella grimontii TaxID=82981 RepID=A0AAV5N286_9GAMM|nr:hotdog fold thioesterase [Leminorella grimontii]KFC96253.1 YdiI family protein [Leminorella grimontii ATCC 33999 = DSM 5078]GKX54557.1 1,4-dihydroxy-2-naphthoyl-CoA hydrolase [Leminorella grimontii]GKX57975.1 1,4-dihydroxy-2-naphthoyl-CoA hydrolase [Leminorella grimontii]VFS58938.1 Esterase YdiI [Leminorella grimontii]
MWKRQTTLEALNQLSKGTMMEHIDIVFTQIGPDFLEATMPVDRRTTQTFGLLHGGASVVLAETIGSVAGYLCTEGDRLVVGVEINANHVRSARQGRVRGVAKAVHLGRSQQVWDIRIYDEADKLCCISRLTTSVLDKKAD